MIRRRVGISALLIGLVGMVCAATASADDFYDGKTVRFIVGYRAGGGYDTYTRLIARHMNRHIPGAPTLIVENMGGAGSLIAANYIYNAAKPDGLTVGVFASGQVREEALGNDGVKFNAEKFGWLGAPTAASPACAIMGFTGLKTWDDVKNSKKELNFGSTGPGSTTHDLPILVQELAHAPIKVIPGYKGTSAVRAAMQRKELDGACWTWESMRSTARGMLDAKGDDRLIPFLIEGEHDDPAVANAVQFTDAIEDKEDLSVFKGFLNAYKFFRPLALPPGVPQERLTTLRTALEETLKDPQFLAEAKKAKLDIKYISAQQIDKFVEEILAMSPEAKSRLKSLLQG